MTLVLQIENYRTLENGGPVQFTVPEQGAKVGRSASMDWTLPDQTRHISSHHFDILAQNGVYYLRDVSTNGTYLYATRERVSGYHQLRDGDRFQVGTYLICAAIQERTQIAGADQTVFMAQPGHAAADTPAPSRPAPTPPAPAPTPPMPAAPPVPPPPAPAPVAAPQPAPLPPEPRPVPPPMPAAVTPPAQPEPQSAPATYAERPQEPDPLPPPSAADPVAEPHVAAPSAEVRPDALLPDDPFADDPISRDPIPDDPFADPTGVPDALTEPPTDEMGGPIPAEETAPPQKRDYSRIFEEVPERALQRPPQADKTGFDDPAPLQAPPSVEIPELDFLEEEFSAPSMPPTGLPDADEMTGQLSLPPHEFLALEQAARAKLPGAEGKAGAADPAAILRAFCKGAGLPEDKATQADAEALAEALGRSARIAATEIKLMLDARASTKQFTRGGARTMRQATDSNPLKFMPDASQALDVMFLNPRDGYQTAPDALKEALADLRMHQTALFAAIQPALMAVIAGLDPEEIEAETEGGLMSSSGRSWELYKTLYAERTEGHDNGLLDVFLKHFAKAYTEMIGAAKD